MKRTIFTLLFVCIFSFGVFGQNKSDEEISIPKNVNYSDTGNVLERKDSFVQWKNSYFSEAVKSIFWVTTVPSGLSLAFENVGENEIKIDKNPKSVIVRDLLDEIIKYDSRYQWKEINGVINISPQNDYPILDVRIAEFKFETPIPSPFVISEMPILNELEKKLIETKEFQSYLKERKLLNIIPGAEDHGFFCCGFIGRRNSRGKKVSIDLKDATVREILNEIVRQRDFGTWTYQEFNVIDEGKLYHLYRLNI